MSKTPRLVDIVLVEMKYIKRGRVVPATAGERYENISPKK